VKFSSGITGGIMRRREHVRVLGFDIPARIGRVLSALGMTTVFYGLIRYTFIGEWFEHLFRDMTGYAPVEGFAGCIADDVLINNAMEPGHDFDLMKDEMRTSEE
jgi:hypothetical protein